MTMMESRRQKAVCAWNVVGNNRVVGGRWRKMEEERISSNQAMRDLQLSSILRVSSCKRKARSAEGDGRGVRE